MSAASFQVFATDLDKVAEDKSAAGLFLRIMLHLWRAQAPLPGDDVGLARALNANLHTVRAFLPKLVALGVVTQGPGGTRIAWMERRITEHVNRVKAARDREGARRERRSGLTNTPPTSPGISPPTSRGSSPPSSGYIPGVILEKDQRYQRNDEHEKKHGPYIPSLTLVRKEVSKGGPAFDSGPTSDRSSADLHPGDPPSTPPLPPSPSRHPASPVALAEIEGLNGSTPTLVGQLARSIAGPLGHPRVEEAHGQVAIAVATYGADATRVALNEFVAKSAGRQIKRPTLVLFVSYAAQAAKRLQAEAVEAARVEARKPKAIRLCGPVSDEQIRDWEFAYHGGRDTRAET